MKFSKSLAITSIANDDNEVLQLFAEQCNKRNIYFVVAGDSKSPENFELTNCDYFSLQRQRNLSFRLASSLPEKKYSRKNIGYLVAMSKGTEVIVETDDDNFPLETFWEDRNSNVQAYVLQNKGWVNIYKYFTDENIWPRGFDLKKIQQPLTEKGELQSNIICPIQQGLANLNPDVDAIFRLTSKLPLQFNESGNFALGENTWCPFNSQNTTWFKDAFPLLYLPTFCSFRMTDIWRSFVAQRIAWTNGWHVLFHNATVYQLRNEHDFLKDFQDEVLGYLYNGEICNELQNLHLKSGNEFIFDNMIKCYEAFIDHELITPEELKLLNDWIEDCNNVLHHCMN